MNSSSSKQTGWSTFSDITPSSSVAKTFLRVTFLLCVSFPVDMCDDGVAVDNLTKKSVPWSVSPWALVTASAGPC